MALVSAFTITNSNRVIVDLWNGEGTKFLEVLEPGQLSNQYSEIGTYRVHPHSPLGYEPPIKPPPEVLLEVVVTGGPPGSDQTYTLTRTTDNFSVQTIYSSVLFE